MSRTAELEELYKLIGSLRRCVTSLASRYGDAPATRRIVNDAERIFDDIDRLHIDAEELELEPELTQHKQFGERIPIPDTQYDTDFWRDVDDEGVGGQTGARECIFPTRKRR
jgi:hypothetical protein